MYLPGALPVPFWRMRVPSAKAAGEAMRKRAAAAPAALEERVLWRNGKSRTRRTCQRILRCLPAKFRNVEHKISSHPHSSSLAGRSSRSRGVSGAESLPSDIFGFRERRSEISATWRRGTIFNHRGLARPSHQRNGVKKFPRQHRVYESERVDLQSAHTGALSPLNPLTV